MLMSAVNVPVNSGASLTELIVMSMVCSMGAPTPSLAATVMAAALPS